MSIYTVQLPTVGQLKKSQQLHDVKTIGKGVGLP